MKDTLIMGFILFFSCNKYKILSKDRNRDNSLATFPFDTCVFLFHTCQRKMAALLEIRPFGTPENCFYECVDGYSPINTLATLVRRRLYVQLWNLILSYFLKNDLNFRVAWVNWWEIFSGVWWRKLSVDHKYLLSGITGEDHPYTLLSLWI